MLFIVEQRLAQQPGLELLTPRDIVEMLKETLPRKPEGKDAIVARIIERHKRRRGAISLALPDPAKARGGLGEGGTRGIWTSVQIRIVVIGRDAVFIHRGQPKRQGWPPKAARMNSFNGVSSRETSQRGEPF